MSILKKVIVATLCAVFASTVPITAFAAALIVDRFPMYLVWLSSAVPVLTFAGCYVRAEALANWFKANFD